MKTDKREQLKNYTQKVLFPLFAEIKKRTGRYFLTQDLKTKKGVERQMNKVLHCSDNMYKASGEKVDVETGEILGKKNVNLNSSTCGYYTICPICARQRADVIVSKYIDQLTRLSKLHKYHYMLTPTVADCDTLTEGMDNLSNGLRNFFRQGQRRKGGKRSGGESGKIKASLFCTEVTPGKNSGKPHVHAHGIVFTDEPLDFAVYDQKKKKEIIRHFNEVEGYKPNKKDLLPSARMPRQILNKKTGKTELKLFSPLNSDWYAGTKGNGFNIKCQLLKKGVPLEKQLREMIKYATKLTDASEQLLFELLTQRQRRRFIMTTGSLRGIGSEDTEENEEFLKIENAESKAWDWQNGKYKTDSPELEKFLSQLVEKRDEIKAHKIACNKIRGLKIKAKDGLKPVVKLFGLAEDNIKMTQEYLDKKLQIIDEIDTIDKVERYVCNHLWCKLVKINRLKNPHLRSRKVATPREKFYWDYFLKEYEKIK